MIRSDAPSWQLILADLALILFLVTLSALAFEEDVNSGATEADGEAGSQPQVAPSQALFRQTEGGPTISQWLSSRPLDDRTTLTVFARHKEADRDAIWRKAQELADDASGNGFAVRVVITSGSVSDVHASLAYDAPESRTAP